VLVMFYVVHKHKNKQTGYNILMIIHHRDRCEVSIIQKFL
jgi:hypothetical protein